jgi:hypothetical protein
MVYDFARWCVNNQVRYVSTALTDLAPAKLRGRVLDGWLSTIVISRGMGHVPIALVQQSFDLQSRYPD